MSPTDPPLPPSPDEPTEEPLWAGGEPGGAPAAEAHQPDTPEPDVGWGDLPLPGDETAPESQQPDPGSGWGDVPMPDEPSESSAEPPTGVLPVTGEDVSEPLVPTDLEPTEAFPPVGEVPTEVFAPTGTEPTELLVGGAVVADGTGEFTREHRRRVSHRRYVMRRIGVALATVAVVGAGVWALVVLLGDDDDDAGGGTESTTPVTSEGALAPVTTRATTTTAATETTEPGSQTSAAADTTEASTDDPATSATAGPSDPPEETDPPADTENTTATASSPPGTVVYDLDVEASCEIGQTLRRGDSGPQVRCLQERLNEITVSGEPSAVDGAFGAQTEAAVRAFQEANELGVDGIVGPATGELLGIWPG